MNTAQQSISFMARAGYAAKGVVYIAIGLLSAGLGSAKSGRGSDSNDAIRAILEQPFGNIALALLTAGLCCYALWRLLQALCDIDHFGNNAKGISRRARAFISGAVYCSLAFGAARALAGASRGASGDSAVRDWTAEIMRQPFGKVAVLVGGLALIGYGMYQLYRAWSASFCDELDLSPLAGGKRRATERICAAGIAARGVVFGIIGGFVAVAGWHSNPNEARGLAGALNVLPAQPHGPWLLALVALGLAAYGLYCWVKAAYGQLRSKQS